MLIYTGHMVNLSGLQYDIIVLVYLDIYIYIVQRTRLAIIRQSYIDDKY